MDHQVAPRLEAVVAYDPVGLKGHVPAAIERSALDHGLGQRCVGDLELGE
jgi:hypothetical protein